MGGLSRNQLAWFCRTLGSMLDAGLAVERALRSLHSRASGRMKSVLQRVESGVGAGATLTEALERTGAFPDLFLRLVEAGEESGRLERILNELAEYYELQRRLWRGFLSQITVPAFEYVLAVAVMTFALYVLRALENPLGDPWVVLACGYGIPAALIAFYFLVLKPLGATRAMHEVLLRVPVLGGVVRSLALHRFSLVMQLSLEAGVSVTEAVQQAARATGNRAFEARGAGMADAIDQGADLTAAMTGSGLFPHEYMEIVAAAEESGKLSERFGWLASHHSDRAEHRLGLLAGAMGKLVWVAMAAVVVYFIFRVWSNYLGGLRSILSRGA